MATDVATNRSTRKWTRREQIGRVIWALATPLFRFSPRPLWGWRRMLLRMFGARIGADVHIYPSVRITIPWHLDIGDQTAIGEGAILYALGPIRIEERATHDWRDPAMPLVKAPLVIGANAWICADAFVGPDVSVGAGAILGARGVAMKDLEMGGIYAGNPAQLVSRRA